MSTTETSLRAHRALSDWTRVALLEELRRAPAALDAQELAERAGIHVNTVRFHLEVLARAGLVASEIERRLRRGRPRRVWHAVADAGPEAGYRMLAEVLSGYLSRSSPEVEEIGLEIGTRWGSQLAQGDRPESGGGLARVLGMLTDLGFSPELDDGEGGSRINLHRCPFLEVATGNRRLICSAHLGLLRGALAEVEAGVTVSELQPLVEPNLCVAHLANADPAAGLGE
ncbi:MAG: helix-turn-helix transcriptional regulator [Candidatus Dormibacteria bacterium]